MSDDAAARRRRATDDCGLVTIQYVVATAFTLLLFVVLCNGLVDLYVRAAVRDALDDGVRAAVVHGAPPEQCQRRIDEAIGSLVRGTFARRVIARCSVDAGVVRADARVSLPSFLPALVPGWSFTLRASTAQEGV